MDTNSDSSNQQGGRSNKGRSRRRPSQRGGGQAPKTDNRSGGNRSKRRRGRRGRSGGQQRGQQHSQGDGKAPEREVRGLLELSAKGAGLIRENALATRQDPAVPVAQVRALGLRPGDLVEGTARGQTVQEVVRVNGHGLEGLKDRIAFDRLTALHPDTQIVLGPTASAVTGRLLDLIAPVGRGQRGLIVAPPKAGKTTILTDIAAGIARDPELTLIVCLVAERPEEATEVRRAVSGMVLAADLDMSPGHHTRVAELGVEHAKRLTEEGRHVVVLLDSLTRLARAYNLSIQGGGRTLSGGMDAAALQPVRKIFGAARSTEEAGSLTIIATCLIDTGSLMDDVVYEEFKGTGNMEVHLDRKLAERRLYPAINIGRSGTRKEELLLDPQTLQHMTGLRRKLAGVPADQALTALLKALQRQVFEGAAEAAAD
jgi:transcription termination factor Rho